MRIPILMPQLGESIAEATIVRIGITAGATVHAGQEIMEVETYIRDTARLVADQMGVDFKLVRQVMLDAWRKHRGARAEQLTEQAEKAEMSPTEREANI